MNMTRMPLFFAGAALAVFLSAGPVVEPAMACPGQEGACACKEGKAGDDAKCAGCAECKAAKAAAGEEGKEAAKDCTCKKGDQAKCDGCPECKAAADGKCPHGKEAAKDCACKPGDDGKCACGSDCKAEHGGECIHGKADGKAAKEEGACGSCGSCGAGAAAPAGGHLRAAIDPATGKLVEPEDDDLAPSAGLSAGEEQSARQVRQPGGGVMVAAPADLAPKAVATIDDKGVAHAGCAE
jgi:hypothetical protein